MICDCRRGLLRVDPSTGAVADLVAAADGVDGQPLGLCNNAAIGRDGTIYFSDCSPGPWTPCG